MRLRNKPWAADKINENNEIVIPNPEVLKGNWASLFGNTNPIHIEIGTGRGNFITGMAKQNPDVNFIGIERFQSVIIDAIDKVMDHNDHNAHNAHNAKLLNVDANLLHDFFEENELSRIYLNFSDPWPKNRHEKRRLTYKSFLTNYEKVLNPKGEIHFKTDNQGLFEYSLESFSRYGLVIKNISLDLHNSDLKNNVMTEYEEKFSKQGNRIYRCEAEFIK